MSLFCRHNRFTADCPICSKGTVLDAQRATTRRKPAASARSPRPQAAPTRAFSGPHVAAPARKDEDGALYVIRLERVPGGVRLGEWRGSALTPRAPVMPVGDLVDLIAQSGEALQARDAAALGQALQTSADPAAAKTSGVSRGRSGDFKEELRIERLEDGRLRVARWVLRPAIGWELQDAPPMLPAVRYAEAVADAARGGLLAAGAPSTPS